MRRTASHAFKLLRDHLQWVSKNCRVDAFVILRKKLLNWFFQHHQVWFPLTGYLNFVSAVVGELGARGELGGPMPGRTSARFRFEYCFGRNAVPCTGRQIRNGFFAVNILVWAFIVILACKLIA